MYTRTDALTKVRTDYSYDGAGRLSLAKETDPQGRQTSWQYCFDPAGNLTSRGETPGCPGHTAYTYNDASQLIARNGITTGWSYDAAGNETAARSTDTGARTAEQYTGYGQLKSLTSGGTSYPAQYASTDSSERTRLGETLFHNGPLGLSGQTTGGKDTEFIREPGGTLNSVSTGGSSRYYLTDALGSVIGLIDESGKRINTYLYTPDGRTRTGTVETLPSPSGSPAAMTPPASTTSGPATTTPRLSASPSPIPPARRSTPTSTRKATPSTASTRAVSPP
ncbi:hypothetical protein SCALM49S_01956 [Streptomyces californicus]